MCCQDSTSKNLVGLLYELFASRSRSKHDHSIIGVGTGGAGQAMA